MRKYFKIFLLACVFAILLCGSALAVGEKGMYDVTGSTGVTLTAKKKDVTATVSTQPITINNEEKQVSLDTERLEMTVSGVTEGTEYLVFVLKGANATVPDANNIVYIDQKSGTNAQTFDLYPKSLENGTYTVCLATSEKEDKIKSVGTFSYYASYKRGDADGSGRVNGDDSVAILRYVVRLRELTPTQREAADVTGDKRVNGDDSVKILRWIVRLVDIL